MDIIMLYIHGLLAFFSSENKQLVLEDVMKSHVGLVMNSDPECENIAGKMLYVSCQNPALFLREN